MPTSCAYSSRLSKHHLWGQEEEGEGEGGHYMEREARVLSGIVAHVLPRVGSHVKTLDLAHGKAVSNEIVRHILDGL